MKNNPISSLDHDLPDSISETVIDSIGESVAETIAAAELAAELEVAAKENGTGFMVSTHRLIGLNKDFLEKRIPQKDFRVKREELLGAALNDMAAEFGAKLQPPLTVSERGEFHVISIPDEENLVTHATKPFGESFAKILRDHKGITGLHPGYKVTPKAGWCRVKDAEVERMVLEHYAAKAHEATSSAEFAGLDV